MINLRKSFFLRAVVAAGFMGATVAAPLQAAESSPKPLPEQTQPTRDVRLDATNSLRIRLVNTQGDGIANTQITVRSARGEEFQAVTDVQGHAVVNKLHPGVYIIPTGTGVQTVRLWTSDQAPPRAIDSVAVVVDDSVVRGQGLQLRNQNGGVNANTLLLLTTTGLATYAFVRVLELDDRPASY